MARPLGDDEKAEIRRLYADGLGRNAIARTIDRAVGTVTAYCAAQGLLFDRSETEVAVHARKVDLAAMRAQSAIELQEDADRLRRQMWEPAVVFAFGGKENVYTEEPVSEPPPADKRTLMAAAVMAYDRSLKLSPPKAGGGSQENRSMLGTLAEDLRAWVSENESDRPEQVD
jgi:hypothetical protein